MPSREIIKINSTGIKLNLSAPRSKVRISDIDGNHANKPTIVRNVSSNWVEWMITNDQLNELSDRFLNSEDKKILALKIEQISNFLNNSEYAKRTAKKATPLGKFEDFDIFEYGESFFSLEKVLDSNVKIRITFKMGDYTLAPHMFILLPFDPEVINLYNSNGLISDGSLLGSGGFAIWKPNKEVIYEAMQALAHASEGHKQDLLKMLQER